MNARITRTRWVDICRLDDILAGGSHPALVGRLQLAVHRLGSSDAVYATDDFDPYSKAYVLSRGQVDDRAGEPRVESPVYRQSFSLLTGTCVEDESVRVNVYPARVREGRVELQVAAVTLDSFESLEAAEACA
jgi:nitrite reductase (NADH) small subunit